MADADLASVDGPGRRRESWSLKTIVENVSGRPITDFQDPTRPVHPYLVAKMGRAASSSREGRDTAAARGAATAIPGEPEPDPIDHVYPPLTGATGRTLHGPKQEHHSPTLHALEADGEVPLGSRPHAPGPSRRPERIYLHYLLLHVDRLSDHALAYLKRAVDEEIAHREPEVSRNSDEPLPP